ncbi:hypothetical protein MRB53_004620 [Persea americana]|uniref:Uncharacterized protein n=1 Tax=Persea americana TaxID=3435 RepID=A0ACC2MCI0_PERAE|nr:hypothetical protein MRB53_004620 [Persea americana]
MPSKLAQVPGNAEQKRGTIYQSSYAVRKLKEAGVLEGTRKVLSSCSSDISLTLSIIDALSQPSTNKSIQHFQQKKSAQVSLNTDLNLTSVGTNYIFLNPREIEDRSCLHEDLSSAHKLCSSNDFLEICLKAEDAECQSEEKAAEPEKRGLVEDLKFRCSQARTPESNDNNHSERDMIHTPLKSFSAKAGMTDLHCPSEFDRFECSPKAYFTSQRRVLDPVTKSLPQRSPFSITDREIGRARNKATQRSLLHDFSKATSKAECKGSPIRKEASQVTVPSPAHLHGFLKLKHNHGMPFFEFSVTDLGDVLGAQIWRTDNAFNWVYTFHSLSGKKKSNSSKDRHGPSSMVGQMQVSCYLCSEMRNGGSLHNSTVTEFVAYDLAPMRRGFAAAQESPRCSPNSIRPINYQVESNGVPNPDGCRLPANRASGNDNSDTLSPYPWEHMDLHPHLETVAIEIQVPSEKRESLKDKGGYKVSGREDFSVSISSEINQRSDDVCNRPGVMEVKVVTPSGTHGLPNTEGGGPSPLLDRWRSGGGCGCGGWDMACPISVFSSPSVENTGDHPFLDDPQPFQLFMQGAKEKVPALSIILVGDGEYCINFHAQLSTLQAFSICVALLHSVEVPTSDGHKRNMQRLQCNSLKILLDEEVRFLIEAVTEEEKWKAAEKTEDIPSCFVLDPPFSPIGRV